jgi:hypothetical protein
MKTLFIISSILFSNILLAKCNTRAIGVIHESGFGISFGGGGSSSGSFDKNVTNVPLTINGELACFKKTSKFDIKAESKKDSEQKNKMVITPMKLEYENIPNPHFRQYFFIENNANPLLRKIHQMSFVCTGEIPLSIEATSDNVLKVLSDNSSASVSVSHVFATGAAADNLKRANFKFSTQPTFDFFGKLYKDKSSKEIAANDCCNDVRIPSILNSTSINSLAGVERSIASNFTTMGAEVPNGCSADFIKTMNSYLLENYKNNESLKDYKISEKWFSNDLVIEW